MKKVNENRQPKVSTRGGSRANSGRKKLDNPKQILTVRIDPALLEWVDTFGKDKAKLVEQALRLLLETKLDELNG